MARKGLIQCGGAELNLANHPHARRTVCDVLALTKAVEPMLQLYSAEKIASLRAYCVDRSFSAAYRALKACILSFDKSYDYIICVPWLTYGGADLEAIHALRAAQERHGLDGVLLVVTDSDKVPAKHWLPSGTNMRVLSDMEPGLSEEDRNCVLVNLIHHLRPTAVLNVNSRVCWNVFKRYGMPLAHSTKLYAMLFCYDYTPEGRAVGYATEFFRECFSFLSGIYADNASFPRELIRQFGVPSVYSSKFVTLYQPQDVTSALGGVHDVFPSPPKDGRFRVFWAGRICRQKNPLLLLEIARLRPNFVFDIYGVCEEQFEATLREHLPVNAHLRGVYSSFDAIPASSYDAFLYTSLWDGLPNVLIKAGALKIAIVASGLDGITELIDETTGWPIGNLDAAEDYAKALDQIANDPHMAEKRAGMLYCRVMERHSWEKYVAELAKSPSFIE